MVNIKTVNKLPKNPRKGQLYAVKTRNGRVVTFRASGKSGFGKFVIVSNEQC